MVLTLIGLGLGSEKDITVKGLEVIKASDVVYLESYTSLLQTSTESLERFYGKKIILADRELVEKKAEETILSDAKSKNVCFLVIGDVFSATTHIDLLTRAKEKGIQVNVIHNASILSAIGATGLQVYKFGKVTSIPFNPEGLTMPLDYLRQNKSIGAHTLFLLDLDPLDNKFLTIPEAIEYLSDSLDLDTKCVGCARIGSEDQLIIYGPAKDLLSVDWGKPPHCFVVPGTLHFMEEEFLTGKNL